MLFCMFVELDVSHTVKQFDWGVWE